MIKKVEKLLERAKAFKNPSEDLKNAVQDLELISEEAKASFPEFENLKRILDSQDTAQEEKASKKKSSKEIPPAVRLAGIRQVGDLWYSKKDNYTKSFESSEQCANYFQDK